jgi:hypothetical protein
MNSIKIFICLFSIGLLSSCEKGKVNEEDTNVSQYERLKYSLVTLVPTNSFNSLTTYWNYNYPWGTDHNGSARMRPENVSVSSGVLTCVAYPGTVPDKPSIHYFSGTIWCKTQVTVSDSWPLWRVSGQFQCPSAKGTWPAFWLNNANGWPPEADIMEFKGSNVNWCNTYKNLSGQWSSTTKTISNPGNWHTYTAWIAKYSSTDVKIEYWIDGTLVATHYGKDFMNCPLNLIIDLQMEGSSGSPGPTGNTYLRARNVTIQRSATL